MTVAAPVTVQSTQPPAAPALPAGSVLMQVSSALGGILLLILLAGWLFRRLGFAPQARNNKLLNLRASCRRAARARGGGGSRRYLAGIGRHRPADHPLHTLPAPPKDEGAADAATPADFRQLMQKF